MPLYVYKCDACGKEFEIRHSMSYEEQTCIHCNSEDVFKIPSLNIESHRRIHTKRVGKIVDKYIKDAKEEVKQDKTNLRKRKL